MSICMTRIKLHHFKLILNVISIFSIVVAALINAFPLNVFGQINTTTAESIFQNKSLVIPPNIKQLVILIPNEGHHGPGEIDEARFIADPFVPQNVVASPGTRIIWYNGDVAHEHNIVVRDANSNNQIFQTGLFPELEASRSVSFNNTGNYQYADTVEYEGGFIMTGNIKIVEQVSNVATTTSAGFDTVGALMVPLEDTQSIVASLRSAGFGINSMHSFQDLRSEEEEEGDQQTLLVWTANGMEMSEITSTLQQISEDLPYA
jgi:plastocyanin